MGLFSGLKSLGSSIRSAASSAVSTVKNTVSSAVNTVAKKVADNPVSNALANFGDKADFEGMAKGAATGAISGFLTTGNAYGALGGAVLGGVSGLTAPMLGGVDSGGASMAQPTAVDTTSAGSSGVSDLYVTPYIGGSTPYITGYSDYQNLLAQQGLASVAQGITGSGTITLPNGTVVTVGKDSSTGSGGVVNPNAGWRVSYNLATDNILRSIPLTLGGK